jgi:hypothetical protein
MDRDFGKDGKQMNQLSEHEMHQHVTILGWLYIVANAIVLLIGLCGFLFFVSIGAIGAANDDLVALGVLSTIGMVALLFFGVLALPGILAGYGLLKRKQWGQILALIVGILGVFNVPVGTLIGIYTLFVLLQDAAGPYFTSQELA